MFGGGIPILYWFLVLTFFVTYWVDKFTVLRIYRKPPRYGKDLMKTSREWMNLAIILHFGFSFWIFSNTVIFDSHNQDIFGWGSDSAEQEARSQYSWAKINNRINQYHAFIYLVFFAFFLLCFLFKTLIFNTIVKISEKLCKRKKQKEKKTSHSKANSSNMGDPLTPLPNIKINNEENIEEINEDVKEEQHDGGSEEDDYEDDTNDIAYSKNYFKDLELPHLDNAISKAKNEIKIYEDLLTYDFTQPGYIGAEEDIRWYLDRLKFLIKECQDLYKERIKSEANLPVNGKLYIQDHTFDIREIYPYSHFIADEDLLARDRNDNESSPNKSKTGDKKSDKLREQGEKQKRDPEKSNESLQDIE